MLLLVHIDSVLCVEASIHPIPAAVTKSVQPDPKLNHNDNVYQHTQTHKYIKRCAKRAAVLLTAAAPLSTPKSPPSQLPTPLPAASLRSNKLHSCVGPAWSCAAAAAQSPRLKMARIFLRWCSARRCASNQFSSCTASHCTPVTCEYGTMAMHAMPIGAVVRLMPTQADHRATAAMPGSPSPRPPNGPAAAAAAAAERRNGSSSSSSPAGWKEAVRYELLRATPAASSDTRGLHWSTNSCP